MKYGPVIGFQEPKGIENWTPFWHKCQCIRSTTFQFCGSDICARNQQKHFGNFAILSKIQRKQQLSLFLSPFERRPTPAAALSTPLHSLHSRAQGWVAARVHTQPESSQHHLQSTPEKSLPLQGACLWLWTPTAAAFSRAILTRRSSPSSSYPSSSSSSSSSSSWEDPSKGLTLSPSSPTELREKAPTRPLQPCIYLHSTAAPSVLPAVAPSLLSTLLLTAPQPPPSSVCVLFYWLHSLCLCAPHCESVCTVSPKTTQPWRNGSLLLPWRDITTRRNSSFLFPNRDITTRRKRKSHSLLSRKTVSKSFPTSKKSQYKEERNSSIVEINEIEYTCILFQRERVNPNFPPIDAYLSLSLPLPGREKKKAINSPSSVPREGE